MRILNKELLDKFINKHADVDRAIQHWVYIVEEAEWKSHYELKLDFPSADYVGNERYVFNIRGNNYRIVVIASFLEGSLIIQFLGTHAEYTKINCKTV